MNIGVIGLGLVGGSLLKFFADQDEHRVVGFDLDRETQTQAASEGYQISDQDTLLKNSELIIISVPPKATPAAIINALAQTESAIVVDTASVKSAIIDQVRSGVADQRTLSRYLPGHPLAGAEHSGWLAAHRYLLNQATWALCPAEVPSSGQALLTLSRALDPLNCSFAFCSSAEHDQTTAASSHALQIISSIIAQQLLASKGALPALLSGGALRDMTRIAESDNVIWDDIIDLNQEAIVAALEKYSSEITSVAQAERAVEPWGEIWAQGRAGRQTLLNLRWSRRYWQRQELVDDESLWSELYQLSARGLLTRGFNKQGNQLHFIRG